MTICVAVKVHDCLVFAADSAMSLQAGGETINVYAHGNKVFNLLKHKPVCAMFCGMGNIGRSSISSLAKDLRSELSESRLGENGSPYTVKEVADRAKAFLFDERYCKLAEQPAQPHGLEFYIGGYSSGSDLAEIWKISIRDGECVGPVQEFPDTEASFVLWAGQTEALNRLILGFSQHLPGTLLEHGGMDPEKFVEVMGAIRSATTTSLAYDPMPTGDAIALADFLVSVVKGYVHFLHGADTVGGDTDIATVTPHEGFRWIRRKHFYPRELNLETDHV